MRIIVLIIIGLNFTFSAYTQEKTESVDQLNFMVGKWDGNGWILGKDRIKKHFSQSEIIQSKVKGRALIVNGLGYEIDSTGAITDREIHEAFGIISYNNERKTVTMISFSSMKGRMESDMMILGEKKLQWSFKDEKSGATIRFTEDFSKENKWSEIGEVSMDGENWHQFFEMNLSKQ
ncbi:DUF1579 domain-containing protein [Mangrovivirga cuniculi]|uniref:DUF1579 domain-containing protein n=1 Tax=Mangrovivirga cuniculi TaxID=2715131 RepID=A0A4D7K9V0_9BACT|nr:DUF1579 domain-containing protein [Mangrovivirga cuniculi]QCK16118.1 hypothetical protein DCC35_15905 [Mangrovivirga cuniculi]